MLRRSRLIAVVTLGLTSLLMSALVWAFWTASGVGTASGTVASQTAPTGVAPTVAAGSDAVAVDWSGVIGPDGGPIDGYYVERYSGTTPTPACSSAGDALLPV